MATPRCTLIPLPDHQVQFLVEGKERLRWHYGPQYPRPFFYPLTGPASGLSLTRMGHPGAPDHDHHRSIWFAHNKVQGVDFWREGTTARIQQKQWLCYQDGDDEAILAVRLGWNDGHDPKDLLEHDLFAALRPGTDGETLLELQSSLTPVAEQLELQQTNFGILAVRMAKSLSAIFGSGKLTSSEGAVGEPAIFAKPASWMDYSGEQPGGFREGITLFDHPGNPGYPASWHVRDDGWMSASLCLRNSVLLTRKQPLTLRYQIHAHRGLAQPKRAGEIALEFHRRPAMSLVKTPSRGSQFGVKRG